MACLTVLSANAWDPVVQNYRNMIIKYNGGKATTENVPEWASTTRALRQWMMYVAVCVCVCVLLVSLLYQTGTVIWKLQGEIAVASKICQSTLLNRHRGVIFVCISRAISIALYVSHRANDPDYPIYHLAAPEGWNNDPNGIIHDEHVDGLYHRFYQYDKTYGDDCMHGNTKHCAFNGTTVQNPASRVWGHTVSKDGAIWEDWPGIDADSKWDAPGVFSGNCAIRDNGKPVCIYSNGHCSVGVCAYSDDYVTWRKTGCMTQAPSPRSQTNHDTSIWRDGPGSTWFILSGGCTYNGGNVPVPGVPCKGNAQVHAIKHTR